MNWRWGGSLRVAMAVATAIVAVGLSCNLPVLDEESYLAIVGQLDPARPYDWSRPWPPWGASENGDSFVYAHPPGFLWWIWAWVRVAGTEESMLPALKVACALPWALLLGWSVGRLAERVTRHPWLVGGLWLAAPITVLGIQRGLMPDLMVTALSTYAVVAWMEGLAAEKESHARSWMVGAGVALAFAAWTKYPALLLVPVLLVHAHVVRGTGRTRIAWLVAGALWLAGEAWLCVIYGRPHLAEVLGRMGEIPRGSWNGRWLGTAVRLSVGVPVLAFLVRGWRWCLVPMALGGAGLAWLGAPAGTDDISLALLAVFAMIGLGPLVLGVMVMAPRVRAALPRGGMGSGAPDLLLGGWLLATVAGVAIGHNFAAPRYLLPAMAPIALLAVRLWEDRRDAVRWLLVGAVIHGGLSLGMTASEHRTAIAGNAAAIEAIRRYPDGGWFSGEWTFRWRLRTAGWTFFGQPDLPPPAGTPVVVADNASPGPIPDTWERGPEWVADDRFPLKLVRPAAGVGLYGETLGALPLGWDGAPLEEVVSWTSR